MPLFAVHEFAAPPSLGRFGGLGALGLTCDPPQTPTLRPDGSTECCGGPALSDPCSYLNTNPGYIALQAQVTQDAIQTSPSYASFESQFGNYSQEDQQLITKCYYSPGQQVMNDWSGEPFLCPSNSNSDPASAIQAISQSTPNYAVPTNTPSTQMPAQPAPAPVSQITPPALVSAGLPGVNTQAPPPSSGGSGGGGSSQQTQAAPASDPFAFLTETSVGSIPNWLLLAGGAFLLMMLPSLIGGRR